MAAAECHQYPDYNNKLEFADKLVVKETCSNEDTCDTCDDDTCDDDSFKVKSNLLTKPKVTGKPDGVPVAVH